MLNHYVYACRFQKELIFQMTMLGRWYPFLFFGIVIWEGERGRLSFAHNGEDTNELRCHNLWLIGLADTVIQWLYFYVIVYLS